MGGPIVLTGPDLSQGAQVSQIREGKSLLGHANGEPVLLVKLGAEVVAVGATCTHYSGPLGDGLIVGETVRCPLHHACFDLRGGQATGPGLGPIPCFRVERTGETVFVREKLTPPAKPVRSDPKHVLIVGAGAAGGMAAETLRKEGHTGRITLLGAEDTVPVDRPNLSKDYLAGTAPEAWIPIRAPEFFDEQKIELKLRSRVVAISAADKTALLDGGESIAWDALLLATGAAANRLAIPGAQLPHVHTVRTLADARGILAQVQAGKRAVVIGTSFIGLEVAASLRARGMEVSVVGPDALPLEKIMGPQLGAFILALHREHGVQFHLGTRPASITADSIALADGEVLHADLIVAGVGARPRLTLAERAGLAIDRGVVVDSQLRTNLPGIWAAGDIARFPDAHTGERVRIEHWAVAQRQGEAVARSMLGIEPGFSAVPFFWSSHYDVQINYVGHAEKFDRIAVDGDLAKRDCALTFYQADQAIALATVGRDLQSLQFEAELEKRRA